MFMLDDSLLQTRLYPPPIRAKRVARRRLVERLNAGLWQGAVFSRKLTLVSAPAGFGKTTLAAEWLAGLEFNGRPPRIAWLTLDEMDNDPARFITYLLAALRKVDPAIGQKIPASSSPQQSGGEWILTPLINDLAVQADPIILVFEDYHAIHNPLIHQQVKFIFEHLPACVHLVIITREDPLLPLARLRSQGQLGELRQEDLRFNESESAAFLRQVMELDLNPEDVQALQRRTEGWIAGLQLAALSLQGQPDRSAFIDGFTGSNRYILDYLFEEIFSRQDSKTQQFLVKTAILPRLSAGLCDAVLERNDGYTRLQALEHANLFIKPLDPGHTWYRYHGLFRDLLLHQLQIQEVVAGPLHRRAAAWLESHGHLGEAVEHALAAGDWETAGALIDRQLAGMLKHGEIATLIAWFRRLPDEFIRSSPDLSIDYSWPLIFAGEYAVAEDYLARADALAAPDSPLSVHILTVRAYLARCRGDVRRTIEYSELALQRLPETLTEVRPILAVNLGMAYWHSGQMAAAEKALNQALREAQSSDNIYAWLSARIFLVRVRAVRGELRQAARVYTELLEEQRQAPVLAIAYLDLGALHYEWNELSTAREYLTQGVALCETSGNIDFRGAAYLLLARLYGVLGDWDTAGSWLEKCRLLAGSKDAQPALKARLAAGWAQAALAQDDLERALEWDALAQASAPGLDLDPHPFYRFLGLAGERLLIAQGRNAEAAQRLVQKAETADLAGWTYAAIAARLLQTLTADTPQTATAFICQALQLSHAGGFIRTYIDAGPALIPFLVEAARRGVHPEYVGRILAAFEAERPKSTAPVRGAALTEPLSERELEVLRLVIAGLSNRDIADQLTVSLGTVKTHLHSIYGKLAVSSRSQVIRRARELALFD